MQLDRIEVTLSEDQLEALAALVAARLNPPDDDGWLDTRAAAAYIGCHPVTLRTAAVERRIPYEQDGPGCKLWFRRSALDAYRRGRASV